MSESASFPECEQFGDVAFRYQNCRHERLTPEKCDKWRIAFGLPPVHAQHANPQPPAWDVSQPSRGLGDVIKKITHATGIDQAVELIAEKVTGKKGGCGCGQRQDALNQMIPFQGTTDGQ